MFDATGIVQGCPAVIDVTGDGLNRLTEQDGMAVGGAHYGVVQRRARRAIVTGPGAPGASFLPARRYRAYAFEVTPERLQGGTMQAYRRRGMSHHWQPEACPPADSQRRNGSGLRSVVQSCWRHVVSAWQHSSGTKY